MIADITIAKACGAKWGRMLPVSHASAYAGLTPSKFTEHYGKLIRDYCGCKRVDITELDKAIDAELREEETIG